MYSMTAANCQLLRVFHVKGVEDTCTGSGAGNSCPMLGAANDNSGERAQV